MSVLDEWARMPDGTFGRKMADVLLDGWRLGVWDYAQIERAAEELHAHMLRPAGPFVLEILNDVEP